MWNWFWNVLGVLAFILVAFALITLLTLVVCGIYWGLIFLGVPETLSGMLTAFFVVAVVLGTALTAAQN